MGQKEVPIFVVLVNRNVKILELAAARNLQILPSVPLLSHQSR